VLVDGKDPWRVIDAAALAQRVVRMAGFLADRGVTQGDRVVWSARPTPESVQVLLAVLHTGAVLVPVSPSATPQEVSYVIADARPVVAITDRDDLFGLQVTSTVLPIDAFAVAATAAAPGATGGVGAAAGHRQLVPDDDALIVYTSGTTGKPKGAVHTHGSLVAGVSSLLSAWDWSPEDRLILSLPLFHVHGLVAGLFGALAAGASVALFDRFAEDAVLDAATSGATTMFFGVPTMYHRLVATGRAGDLATLRLCVSGSAALGSDLWHQLADAGVEVLERYGMTETLLTLSNPLLGERRPGSVGVPLPGVEAAVEDPDEHGVGELFVRGPSLCRGYWGRGEAIGPDAWFPTGDLVSLSDDGFVTIRGRRTELIITGGQNVYPAEVEAVLARHPGVVEVAVVGVPSEEWGETVVAFVVGDPDLLSLRELAATQLETFKCPRDIRFVEVLPRNALGKVVRSQLR
jgi:malonyl-CoA/methylmalonyl-CoA synthetase